MFSEQTDQNEIKQRDKILKKVGLSFENGQLFISNDVRWSELSLGERCQWKMPSTTNSLEATHGQMNRKVRRRINFWNGIYKVIEHLIHKAQTVPEHVKHNYEYEKHKTINHSKVLQPIRINEEIAFYKSTIAQCDCSENKLLSTILGLDVPCCHRYYLNCAFPKIPDIYIKPKAQWETLKVEYNIIKEEVNQQTFITEKYEKNYAIEMIRRFGMCKNREKITEFVEKNYKNPNNKIFFNGQPSSILLLINQGIIYFNTLKKMKKELNNK